MNKKIDDWRSIFAEQEASGESQIAEGDTQSLEKLLPWNIAQ